MATKCYNRLGVSSLLAVSALALARNQQQFSKRKLHQFQRGRFLAHKSNSIRTPLLFGGILSPHLSSTCESSTAVRSLSSSDSPPFLKNAVNSSSAAPYNNNDPTNNIQASLLELKERFQVGDYYIWLYCDATGTPTSWERYRVVVVQNNNNDEPPFLLVIEMATKFQEADDYTTHHRMTVDMTEHLMANQSKLDWRIGFEFNAGEEDWRPFGSGDNVQVFEEKFDIFTMLLQQQQQQHPLTDDNTTDTIRIVQIDSKLVTLTRSERHSYTEAWYGSIHNNDSRLAGIAIFKEFTEHSFSLIEWGREGVLVEKIKVESL